ncbi:MAG: MATE family efflux transporter [Bacteroidales bacterium]|nr:MATE family efflux transporter [Bacteroidales bacterium]
MTDRALNREILRLSVPSIFANLTVPLVGIVDTALAGHLTGGSAAAYIGGISVGSMLLNLLYWNFFFLRTGTGGLTAQAFGRQDPHGSARIFVRGIGLAVGLSLLLLLLQRPLVRLGMLLVGATPEVCDLALRYFLIRIWAAPATIGLMVFRGWFVGMQDSMSSMWTDLVVNGVNIAASVVLSFGILGWGGMGFDGIPTGTVVAQYAGLAFAVLTCTLKYRKVLGTVAWSDLGDIFHWSQMRPFLKMNSNLVGRSLCFTAIYMGYTIIAATFGDMLLACSSIMMQLLMIFSYFTDGFAYAGEALSGRFIGARDEPMLRRTVRFVFLWSLGVAVLFIGVYYVMGVPVLHFFSSDQAVVDACSTFLPWLLIMPPVGCAAFTWDGIYLGATEAGSLFTSMLGAMIGFLGVWFAFSGLVPPGSDACLHLLLAAYFVHLAFRAFWLSVLYKRKIRIAEMPDQSRA